MDVFFYEAFEEEAEALRRLLGKDISFDLTGATVQETGQTAPPARILSIRTQSRIPAAWASSIDAVLSRSTGYDHLKRFRASISKEIPCGFLDEYATRAVAEHAVLMVVALLRRLPAQMRQFPTFNRDGLTGIEFGGKNLLVVGVGRIGGEIVSIARGMGLNVRGVDLVQRHPEVGYTTRDEGLAWADAVVCAMNLTEENRGYFSEAALRKMKPGAVFVNVARGEQSPTEHLLKMMEAKHLGGVGLDVFNDEPELANALRGQSAAPKSVQTLRALGEHPNVLLTPHNAFNSVEAVERKSEFTVRQIRHFLAHKDFLWKI